MPPAACPSGVRYSRCIASWRNLPISVISLCVGIVGKYRTYRVGACDRQIIFPILRTPADIAIVEVGLGGRYDASNVFDKPACTVICEVDYDHLEMLGPELGGSVFTHYLLSGLRGEADRDNDDRVTLTELYAYAYRKTVLRTGTGEVLQHPAIQLQLSGAGEVVLSHLTAAVATLEVSRDAERYLVFSLPSEAMVGELSSEGSGRLALPKGAFPGRAPGDDRNYPQGHGSASKLRHKFLQRFPASTRRSGTVSKLHA
jgi:hypothetical protein